jgi:hypothetical protein
MYYVHTKDPIGCFTEKEVGNYFEYSENPEMKEGCEVWCCYPHVVWVGSVGDQGYRYANVKKTVAYIVTDEDEYGNPVIEKWSLKKNVRYS